MISDDLIKSIKSLDSSIEFEEDSQFFLLEKIDNWIDIAKALKEKEDFDYLMCMTSLDLENNQLGLAYNIHSTKNKISIDDYTPTTIKGWNFIQRPLYTLGHDKYFDLYLEKLNLSKINRICVSDIKKNKDKLLNSKNDDLFLSLVLHKCFFDKEKSTYDYEELKIILNSEKV